MDEIDEPVWSLFRYFFSGKIELKYRTRFKYGVYKLNFTACKKARQAKMRGLNS